MQPFEFHCPTKIVCGTNALRKLPRILTEHNVTKPLVVTGPHVYQAGLTEHVIVPLEENAIDYELFDHIPADSGLDVVERLRDLYVTTGCDGFVIIGGGSVIDTAKGAAASLAAGSQDLSDLQGVDVLTHDLDPLIVIPTTSGTGSEVTCVAVVKDHRDHAKLSFTSYKLVPHVAILDPSLTQNLPAQLTATTALDALTHAIEAYTSVQKNPVSDAFAHEAVHLIAGNLPATLANPRDAELRANLALGSLMAGVAFSNAMVGIVHALGHSLGGLCAIPHGQAMMVLLPHVVRWNLDHGHHVGRYGELLRDLRPDKASRSMSPKMADEAFCSELFSLNAYLHRICDVPITLQDLGVTFEELPTIARQARYDGAALYNCQEFSIEEATDILEAAF